MFSNRYTNLGHAGQPSKPRQIEIFNGQLRYYHGYQFWNGAPLTQWVSVRLSRKKLKIDALAAHINTTLSLYVRVGNIGDVHCTVYLAIRHNPKSGFNFTPKGALLVRAEFEPKLSHGH